MESQSLSLSSRQKQKGKEAERQYYTRVAHIISAFVMVPVSGYAQCLKCPRCGSKVSVVLTTVVSAEPSYLRETVRDKIG
ncbi:hypothetical protein G4O51_00795 [Candidatus Bathyarchaeota archaeon A05DMB-2]|nr:hypothetical protein [Candidatus Bathyarchaeota archaeon A05DMB-2]